MAIDNAPKTQAPAGKSPFLSSRFRDKELSNSQERVLGIRFAFRLAMAALVAVAFLASIAISYHRISEEEVARANASVRSEINYLCLQLDALDTRALAFERLLSSAGITPEQAEAADARDYQLLSDPVGSLLQGYTLAETGTVVIAKGETVVASDDGRIPVGSDLQEALGADAYAAIGLTITDAQMRPIRLAAALADSGEGGYLLSGRQGAYTVIIIEPESMVFRNRGGVLIREAYIAFAVLLVVFLVVDRLLAIMVARRIDKTNDTLQRIVGGELDARVANEGVREFRSLARGINITVDALQDLIGESERRIEQDLATARKIQAGSLPNVNPALPNVSEVSLFASMDPAREVGGDFFDFFELDDHTLAFLIADVSGKGIPASLFMMAAKNEIENRLRAGIEPAEAIAAANAHLCTHNDAGMFVTVWAATLNYDTGLLTFVNAGHNFPLLRHNGTWSWLTQRCGLFLGTFDTSTYCQKTLVLEGGDQLVLYTDGVNEAFNVDGQEYGNDRLEAFLTAHADLAPEELVPALRADVAAWAEGADQSDDVTILAVEMH